MASWYVGSISGIDNNQVTNMDIVNTDVNSEDITHMILEGSQRELYRASYS